MGELNKLRVAYFQMRLWLRSGNFLPQAGTDVDTTKGVNHRH